MVEINGRKIGDSHPVYIIAELGINHNGSLDIAKQLIDVATEAGCDAVKFQKRTPELCVPKEQKSVMRDTPWGRISYMEYRERVEFSKEDYYALHTYCNHNQIGRFASCWDLPSIDFMVEFDAGCIKIPSACLTDDKLLIHANETGLPVILSTGMSTKEQIGHAVHSVLGNAYDDEHLLVAHCTSTYPAENEELNLNVITTLKGLYECPIGYSGHETGLQTTLAAVVLGASFVERHITLDRSMWGSDHAASVEPQGLRRLVRDIRIIESALGDGVKKVYESEFPIMKRLRRK